MKIEKNDERFVATPKTKFLSLTRKENGDTLILKLHGNCFIMQNNRLRLDYKSPESELFSLIKL